MISPFTTTPLSETNDSPLFVNLGAILAGDLDRELPSVGRMESGGHLLYKGRVNEIHGEPGIGKSNVAIAIAAQIIADGGHVVYIDPEDTAQTVVTRLLGFGCPREKIKRHLHYLQDPDIDALKRTKEWVSDHRPALVVLDGMAELLTLFGLNEDVAADTLSFVREYLRPFARSGAAVLVTDHVAKDREGRGRWSRGSGGKIGAYDGAVYALKAKTSYSPTKLGQIILIVAKDRLGGVGSLNATAAEVEFTPWEGGTRVVIRGASEAEGVSPAIETMKPIILGYLEKCPDANARELRRELGGAGSTVDAATRALEADGRLEVVHGGPGKSNRYRLLPPPSEERPEVACLSVSPVCPEHGGFTL